MSGFSTKFFITFMQYDLQKLERMKLEEVREIAERMGLKPRRSQSIREISYAILDAQADQRAAVVQAKEDERAAAGKPAKRERTRGVKIAAKKVNIAGSKSERVKATVGTEKEQLAQMQESMEADNHRPNRTVQQVNGLMAEPEEKVQEVQEVQEVLSPDEARLSQEPEKPAAKKRASKKKVQEVEEVQEVQGVQGVQEVPEEAKPAKASKGRKSKSAKNETELPFEGETATAAEAPTPKAEPAEEELVIPDLGENVIAMGTLECTPDGYGFLRSADYNYLSSPDDIYVSKDQVRQYGLKPGDTVECSIRVNPQPEKFFPME